MDTVVLKGDISLINQEKLAKEYMDKEFKKKPVTSSSSPSKGLDIVVSTEEKPVAPTVQRKNVLESLVKKTKAAESSTGGSTTSTTTSPQKPVVVTSSVVVENKKPSTTTTTSANSEDVLTQIEKLAELKQKGILTEEEYTQKKKQLLGL